MSEIQSFADPHFIKWLAGVLVCAVNALGFFILRGIKKSVDDLWSKRNQDHDLLIQVATKQGIEFDAKTKI